MLPSFYFGNVRSVADGAQSAFMSVCLVLIIVAPSGAHLSLSAPMDNQVDMQN